jgi:hypothetical protein
MVTAGWQEREGEPGTVADPGVPVVELALHRRGEQVFAADAALAASESRTPRSAPSHASGLCCKRSTRKSRNAATFRGISPLDG